MIIKNKSSRLDDVSALWYIQQVIEQGRVSNKGKNYAYSTLFTNTRVVVSVMPNKLSNSFIVCDYKRKKDE
jgi:hypothetical protein